ncbi:uncharacterized protein LOC110104888 [Dendrobium catenatum]|uniref:uncharacterized protein LOC110104888 n=1 Tax=Dendrobium catenatum TaxID=906689 RepID=UPI0009F246F8|nr:uncharacterized protein LOC110104888 [Dendrobium catenatum]
MSMINDIIAQLNNRFSMKHLGLANSFLGLQIKTGHNFYFLSQTNYAASILKLAGMENTKTLSNQLCTKVPEPLPITELLTVLKAYRQITRSLQYLTLTRPYISYAVNLLCQNMHNPSSHHFYLLYRLLRYIYDTLSFDIPIVPGKLELKYFSDADWAGDKETRKSTSGYCTFLGQTLIFWMVKKQHTVARSSTEAEYQALALALTHIIWLRRQLLDFNIPLHSPTTLHCNSMSAIALANNPVFHARIKHIEIDHHFLHDHIQQQTIQIYPVSTKDQIANVLTKSLSTNCYELLRDKLTVIESTPLACEGIIKDTCKSM